MVQQDVCRSRRVHAERRADDAAARAGRLDDIGFEILVEVLGDAHRPEANRLVDALLAHLEEFAADFNEAPDVLRLERSRVRRCRQQEVANQPALAHRVRAVTLEGIGVVPREARTFAVGNLGVLVAAKVVAILHELHGTAERRDLQPVPVQFEGTINLGAQQAAHVGAVRVHPVLVQVAADRRAADVVVLLDAHDVEAGLREEGGRRQAVVACADDDGIIGLHSRSSSFRIHSPQLRSYRSIAEKGPGE